MDLYINYEKAQKQFDVDNLFVVRALAAMHRRMLTNFSFAIRPAFPFDMQYFYDSVTRALATEFSYTIDSVYGTGRPNAFPVNVPNTYEPQWKDMLWVSTGKAGRFIELVQSEGDPDGIPFDLSFACRIAADALDSSTLAFIEDGIGKRVKPAKDPFDDWLKGFSIPTN